MTSGPNGHAKSVLLECFVQTGEWSYLLSAQQDMFVIMRGLQSGLSSVQEGIFAERAQPRQMQLHLFHRDPCLVHLEHIV
jgi:hypothetical protein